jgi:imidazoleglycerol phosphate dehydratase HisB
MLAPYPVPQPVVQHALQVLKRDNLMRIANKRAELLQRRDWLKDELRTFDIVEHVYDSDANFLLVKVRDAARVCAICRENGILVRDQSGKPGLADHVRITVGTQHEMETLLAVLCGEDMPAQYNQRRATITRQTKETAISCTVNLDTATPVDIDTGLGFFDHMLEQLARHGGFALHLECDGDRHVDNHHTVEDCAIALGQTLKQALGDKHGIARYGFTVPMDEARAEAVIDLSGRGYLVFEAGFPDNTIGDLPADMIEHIFRSIAENLQATIHITVPRGENSHHMAEACFKALARAWKQAAAREGDDQTLPSTKGAL